MDRQLSTFEALDLLGSLENLTRQSLPHPTPKPLAKASIEHSADENEKVQKSELTHYRFETSKEEYRPALQDKSLIEALLQFRTEIQSQKQSIIKKEAEPKADPSFQLAPLPEFSVSPKPTQYFRKITGIYQPILRSTGSLKK